MNNIRTFENITPQLGTEVYIADTALVIGDVTIGDECSIWFHSVLRGDINSIVIGKRTNIQDGCVLHVDYGVNPVRIADEVTVGHAAVVHGCSVESRSLIGMHATILSGATIGSGSIVAAGAVVRENQIVSPRTLVAGVPAKPVRKVTDDELDKIINSAQHYVDYSQKYRNKFSGNSM